MNSDRIIKLEGILTIQDLKNYIKDLPEYGDDGEPLEVWIETGKHLSSPVTEIIPLNRRNDKFSILLVSPAFKDNSDE